MDIERDELAQRLGGGLPRNSLGVLVGPAGAGKSVFLQRLAHGALRHGARVAYVSTELGTRNFLEQTRSLGYGAEVDVLEGKLAVYSSHPASGRPHPRPDQLRRLLMSQVPRGRDLVIVDRVSSLLRDASGQHHSPALLGAAMEGFLRWARGGRCVLLAVDPEDVPPAEVGALERVSNLYLELKTHLVGPQALHVIHVRRFERPLARTADVLTFRVEPKAGLILEIKTVSS